MPVLPLLEAYSFGNQNDLGQEIQDIRNLEIAASLWKFPQGIRRGYIVDLFQQRGIFEQFQHQHWHVGNPVERERLLQRYRRLKQEFDDGTADRNDAADENLNDVADNEDIQGFAAENHLRDFLAKNPTCIEPGLTIYQDSGRNGVEFTFNGGRIDILARDGSNRLVVIELKLGRGRNKVVGQLLYYMGWVDNNLGNEARCRGIIIAKDIPDDLALAVQRVPDVKLFRYNFSFTVEAVQ